MHKGADGKMYVVQDDRVMRLESDTVAKVFSHPLIRKEKNEDFHIRLAVDREGTVYAGLKNSLLILRANETICDRNKFNDIHTLYVDNEDNLWVGTETGLYRMLSKAFINFTPAKSSINEQIWSVAEDRFGRIWFESYNHGLQYFDGSTIFEESSYKKLFPGKQIHFYMGSTVTRNRDVIFSASPVAGFIYDGTRFEKLVPDSIRAASFFVFEDPEEDLIISGTNVGVCFFRSGKLIRNLIVHPGNGKSRNVVSIIRDKYHRYWMGGFNGISLLDGDSLLHLPKPELNFEKGGNAMMVDKHQNIWIGNAEGLFYYDHNNFSKVEGDGLDDFIAALSLVGDSALLIGTVRNLLWLDLNAWYGEGQMRLKHFTREDGFLGIEPGQNGIFRDSKGFHWIVASDRVVRFEPTRFSINPLTPQLSVTGISVLNEKMDWLPLDTTQMFSGKLRLRHDQKNIRFDFLGITTTSPERIQYSHLLEGYDKGWSDASHERHAIYTNLTPGNYRLHVKARNADGAWTREAVSLSFYITPAWYQRWWFWTTVLVLTAILLILAGAYAALTRRRRQHRKFEAEKKMAQLKLLTIRNQIDPHFTFNAITSITSLVQKEKREVAYKYFLKLSNLLRSTMNATDKLTVSLGEEITFVSNYLEIQQLRFKEKLSYQIETDPGVDLLMQIPKMTIQTFAENALKHGIGNLEGNGRLLIGIRKNNPGVRIVVEDNGVGREKAKEILAKSSGKGWKILTHYFEYYNRYHEDKIKWKITDLYYEDGKAAGTHVQVEIPASFTFD